MLIAAVFSPHSVLCVHDCGLRQRYDFREPEPEPDGVSVETQTHNKALRLVAPDKLDRLPAREPSLRADDLCLLAGSIHNRRTQRISSLADDRHLSRTVDSLLDNLAVNDSQPVTDQLRRFGAWRGDDGILRCDVWLIVAVHDATGAPITVERVAQSGLPVAGECEPYQMPAPILSPDPETIAPLDGEVYAVPTINPLRSPVDYGPVRTKRLAIERGVETIAEFLRRLAACIHAVEHCEV